MNAFAPTLLGAMMAAEKRRAFEQGKGPATLCERCAPDMDDAEQ